MVQTPEVQEPLRIFDFEDCLDDNQVQYRRRDFFKIAIMKGNYLYHYADKTMEVSGSTMMFFSPDVPYKFEVLSERAAGYFCIFREPFYTERYKGNIRDLPMFGPGGKPSYVLNKSQDKFVSQVFKKMKLEIQSDYAFKLDLVRNYVADAVHPGIIDTPLAYDPVSGEDLVPVDKFAIPCQASTGEISKYILFVASEDAAFSTASEFVADGGFSLGPIV